MSSQRYSELRELRELNAELLRALKRCVNEIGQSRSVAEYHPDVLREADEAIAKAEKLK